MEEVYVVNQYDPSDYSEQLRSLEQTSEETKYVIEDVRHKIGETNILLEGIDEKLALSNAHIEHARIRNHHQYTENNLMGWVQIALLALILWRVW
jgi:hypothetical protein